MSMLAVYLGAAVSAVVASSCAAVLIPRVVKAAGWQPACNDSRLAVVSFFTAMLALFIPIKGVPMLYYLRGALGEFSTTTLIWAVAALIGQLRGQPIIEQRQRLVILPGFAVFALVFYPAALGLTEIDPYAWGYFSTPFLIGLGLLSCVALALGLHWAVFMLCGGLVAASLGVLPSTNAWDYLIDPAFGVYALLVTIFEVTRKTHARLAKAALSTGTSYPE